MLTSADNKPVLVTCSRWSRLKNNLIWVLFLIPIIYGCYPWHSLIGNPTKGSDHAQAYGGISGVIKLRGPWRNDTVFIYLQHPTTLASDSNDIFYSQIDTIYPPITQFLINDLVPGLYEIIVTNDVEENNENTKKIKLYPSFAGLSLHFGIMIKPDTLSVILDTLVSPGGLIPIMRDDIFARIQVLRIFNAKSDRIIFKPFPKTN